MHSKGEPFPRAPPPFESESSFVAAGTKTWEEATRGDWGGGGGGASIPGSVEVTRGGGGGSFVLLATAGLGSLRLSPAGWKRWGRGIQLSGLLGWERLNGPTAGCVPAEAVAFASGPSLAGRGRRVAQSWGGPGAAGSRGRLEGVGPGWGCSSAPVRSARSGTSQSVGAGGMSGRARAALRVRARGAPDSWQLRARSFQGLVLRPTRLFVSCEPRKPP